MFFTNLAGFFFKSLSNKVSSLLWPSKLLGFCIKIRNVIRLFSVKIAAIQIFVNECFQPFNRDGLQDKFNVENVENDERFVEMDVALLKVRLDNFLIVAFKESDF